MDIRTTEEQPLDLPERLGRYRVVGRLAVGGMAEILIGALDGAAGFSRPVVIKRVLPTLARRADFRRMFIDEARIVSGLRHVNIVNVLELGEDESLYLAMEYLEGESLDVLARRLREAGTLVPAALAAYIVAEASAGLHAAHELKDASGVPQQIVHRDVSPHNLFLGYDGSVRVIDFGIAKAVNRETKTETGTLKGKFGYMSPEQIDGRGVDRRVDVFALGVVLWELLTGKRLFARPSQLEIVKAICFSPIPSPREVDPAIDAELDRITQKALCRELDERYATAAELRQDLMRAIRAMTPETIPQDELGRLMHDSFGERIEKKREMLRRIASGSVVTSVPGGLEEDELDSAEHAMPIEPPPTRATARAGASRAWIIGLVAAIVLGLGVGTFVVLSSRGTEREPLESDRDVSVQASPASTTPPAVAPAEQTPAPVSADVTVSIETTPAGATVRVAGEARGTTPLELALPRGTEPLELELALEGHRTVRDTVVPRDDQHLRVVLAAEARRTVRRGRGARAQAKAPDAIFRVD